jgi:hypothetical protein
MSKSKKIEPVIANDLEVQEKNNQEVFDSFMETIGKAAGSKSKQFGEMVFNQLANSCHLEKEFDEVIHCVAWDIMGIAPKDHIEGMLATQMIATHYATMTCFSRAAKASSQETHQLNINSANKLTRSYTAQMEALNRHRGKGQQKITVEHVHVHSGGQAIVGNVAPTKHLKDSGGDRGWKEN